MSDVAIVYQSSDAGAPQLTGQAGSLTALLDAVLVNGYGSGAASKAGAGWSIAYSGANKRAYRNEQASGTGAYLRVDDSGSDFRIARVRAFESMSTIDAGVGPSPTTAQSSSGRVWVKSESADAVARIWTAVATRRAVYLFTSPMAVTDVGYERVALTPHFAGDIASHAEGDQSRFLLIDNPYSGFTAATYTGFTAPAAHWADPAVMPGTPVGHLLRPYTQQQGSTPAAVARCGSGAAPNTFALGGSGAAFPDPVSGGLMFDRALVIEAVGVVRGHLPGVFIPLHTRPFAEGDVITDLAGLGGAKVLAKVAYAAVGSRPIGNSGYFGQLLFDLSNPW